MKTIIHIIVLSVFILLIRSGFSVVLAEKKESPFLSSLETHKPIYILQSWFFNKEGSEQGFQDKEIVVQFGFKKHVFYSLYFAYSQKMFWQTSDQENSRPFRDLNYNPEVFWDIQELGPIDLFRLGITEHESNGDMPRYDASGNETNDSRSWDRSYIYLQEDFLQRLRLGLKLWVVTSPKTDEYRAYFDDNPDMQEYMGIGELYSTLIFGKTKASFMFRHGWKENTGTIQFDFNLPIYYLIGGHDRGYDLYFQYFSGYGNSLRDYNRKITRAALGIGFR